MDGFVVEFAERLADQLLNPKKRVFLGYLLSALVIAIAVRRIAGGAHPRLFDPKIWWSRSARADYRIAVVNQAAMMGVAPRLVSTLGLATLLFEGMHVWFDGRPVLLADAPGWAVAAGFTLALFLLDDATRYLLHRWLHAWPVLWCFHRVHHTAETLTPFTVYRTHPVEGVLFALRATLVQAVSVAGFVFFFGDRAELVTVLGANAIIFAFNVAGSNLRHSHVRISYGRIVERVLISPAQHQIHHSAAARHAGRNFGAVLAVWDWIGGSLRLAERGPDLRFGLPGAGAASHRLANVYLAPFRDAAAMLYKSLFGRPTTMSTHRFSPSFRGGIAALAALPALLGAPGALAQELNIYSHRQPFLINPFIAAYEKKTGVKVNTVYARKGLAQRLQAEGRRSPADVVLTVDIARLHVYADKDLLAAVDSAVLKKNIPAHLRDPGDRWFAFSKRARVVVVSRKAKDTDLIKRYEDLTDARWKGRICARPGSHVYNRALVASMIAAHGEAGALAWARGVVANLARRPQGNDRAQVKAIFEGVCDVSIVNNYYYGKLAASPVPAHREWAKAVRLIFPNQAGRGTHVNISGGGVARHSRNKAGAVGFLEFLTSEAAQKLYGTVNFEYPVNPAVAPPDAVKAGSGFREDKLPIARIADLAPAAQKVIDRAGW
ncbi:MAG: extracellular solute-binding protein [Defluviicoccus sp.]|nr:extracellular solute-binding protein [Defluviicoccus sp.]MDE0278284.1 extracellular solute-binding protein [Defluviicoccus sp.]